MFVYLCLCALLAWACQAHVEPECSPACTPPQICRLTVRRPCRFCFRRPVARCVDPSTLPADVDDVCLVNAYPFALLFRDQQAFTCVPGRRFRRCPPGTSCEPDGTGRGVCCYGRRTCQDYIESLFQARRQINGRTYWLSRDASITADRAQAICQALGGYLVEIETMEEYTAVVDFINDNSLNGQIGVLISGTDAEVENTWRFSFTGRPVSILNWEPGQPDNSGDCLHLIERSNFLYDDIPCNRPDVLFMCEVP